MRIPLTCLVAAMVLSAISAEVKLIPVGEFSLPGVMPGEDAPPGLSGITRVGGDLYYAVADKGGLLYPMTVDVDRVTGAVTGSVVCAAVVLPGADRRDMEGIAWDDEGRKVWVSDELDGSIRAFDPVTGRRLGEIEVPPVYGAFRFNRSFESLSIRSTGLEMWTCNEEALCRRQAVVKDGPPVDDGPGTTRERGSIVRLQKFVRTTSRDAWRPAGQWAYETDPVGGANFIGKARNGVSDVCCLDDGSVLVLEREMSVKKGGLLPSFRCRVYLVGFNGATDVSTIASLNGADFSPVSKKCLFRRNTNFAMYEGICLGPQLSDGSRSVLMVSDGDGGAVARIYALRLVLQ